MSHTEKKHNANFMFKFTFLKNFPQIKQLPFLNACLRMCVSSCIVSWKLYLCKCYKMCSMSRTFPDHMHARMPEAEKDKLFQKLTWLHKRQKMFPCPSTTVLELCKQQCWWHNTYSQQSCSSTLLQESLLLSVINEIQIIRLSKVINLQCLVDHI